MHTLKTATTKMQRLLNIIVTEFSDFNDVINEIKGITVLAHRKMGIVCEEDAPDMD